MSLNTTPSSNRLHIGIFGKRNAGKSSLINAITGQNLAIVSNIGGTTTDPVLKAMELLPLGPVVIIDTPGLDDEGDLGNLRIEKAYQILNKTDIAVLVIDSSIGVTKEDLAILSLIRNKNIPFIIVANKSDLTTEFSIPNEIPKERVISVSTTTGKNIYELKERIAALAPSEENSKKLVCDLINPHDFVVLVVPIDKAAPKGRLILPQQQTIRELLDTGAIPVVTRDTELTKTLEKLGTKPALVITDSQAFAKVSAIVPKEIPLTSFSILFARYKGNFDIILQGAYALKDLQENDHVLISEGCTHHRQCGDIGTVKLPNLLKKYTGKNLNFHFSSGTEFPLDLSHYKVIIHCGGCTLNEKEMQHRLDCAKKQNIPITNYGIAIAQMQGILERSIAPIVNS